MRVIKEAEMHKNQTRLVKILTYKQRGSGKRREAVLTFGRLANIISDRECRQVGSARHTTHGGSRVE